MPAREFVPRPAAGGVEQRVFLAVQVEQQVAVDGEPQQC
jgi:hypothetical protein